MATTRPAKRQTNETSMTASNSIQTGGAKTETVVYGLLGIATLFSLLHFFTSLISVSEHRTQIAGAIERWGSKPVQVMLAGGDTNRATLPAARPAASSAAKLTTGASAPAGGNRTDS